MALKLLLLLFVPILNVETFPTKFFEINQHQTKSYEVFKDILIQNLLVTTDNLKLILNLEREDIYYKVYDEDKLNTKLIDNEFIPKQTNFWKNFKGDNDKKSFKVTNKSNGNHFKNYSTDLPGKHKTKELVKAQDNNINENKANRQDSEEYSPNTMDEDVLNYDISDSLFDNVSDLEKMKREASDDSVLPIPIQGDGDTQMVMGTFQAVMRPMKLPSLS